MPENFGVFPRASLSRYTENDRQVLDLATVVTNTTHLIVYFVNKLHMRYFIYCRKSTESEDRQVLSLDSQLDELRLKFTADVGIEIIDIYQESFSAKAPGRPLFAAMLARIEKGEADGIVAWHPDRLARNSIDGGSLIYLLDQNILKDIKFATFSFENNPQGKFMLAITFGYSKYYVDALSENIKRGNRAKVQRGWRPNAAPIGYLNDKNSRTIILDPERSPLIRRLFEYALTGNYSLRQLWNESVCWDLRSRPHKRSGGRHLSISMIHRVLRNPFYSGQLIWNGATHRGAHEPLVTNEEFERVGRSLSRPEKQGPHKRSFAFTGLIHCGECGFMVTAEEKVNRHGSRYTYYHCTKRRRDYACKQPYLVAEKLFEYLEHAIARLEISPKVYEWVCEEMREAWVSGHDQVERQKGALTAAIEVAMRGLTNTTSLRVRELIGEDEFVQQRQSLQCDVARLQEQLHLIQADSQFWFEPTQSLFWFSTRAISWFRDGGDRERRQIAKACSSNFLLTDKKVSFDARKPLVWVAKIDTRPELRRVLNRIRTLYLKRDLEFLETLTLVRSITDQHPDEAGRRTAVGSVPTEGQ